MGLGSCYSFIKYLMFAFNFLFWLLGCAILGVGIWVRVDPNFKQYVDNTESFNYLYACAYILIIVGVIVMIVGFLGCCGAIRESQIMLSMFFIFLFIIFAVLLSAGIWAIVAKETLKESVTSTLQNAVANYFEDDASKQLMDNLHRNFACCGANHGYADFNKTRSQSPVITCQNVRYEVPCDKQLFAYFSENLIIIAGVAIGIGLVMLLGMVMSMALCCTIRQLTSYNEGRTTGYTRHTASSSWVHA